MKLAILEKQKTLKDVEASKEPTTKDIYVKRYTETEEINKDGVKTITPKWETINLTKKINETAKLIKADMTDERIKMLEEAIEKEI